MEKESLTDNLPIYTSKEVMQILKISASILYRLKQKAGYITSLSDRKQRYTMKEIINISKHLK